MHRNVRLTFKTEIFCNITIYSLPLLVNLMHHWIVFLILIACNCHHSLFFISQIINQTECDALWGVSSIIINIWSTVSCSARYHTSKNNQGKREKVTGRQMLVPWNGGCKDWVTGGVGGGGEGGAEPGRIQRIVKHTTWNTNNIRRKKETQRENKTIMERNAD